MSGVAIDIMWLAGGGGLVCLLAGVLLLIVGMRGKRVDRHPVCARCRFDLEGVWPGAGTCPECGATLRQDEREGRSIRRGNRVRRRRLIGIGIALLLFGAGGMGVWGYTRLAHFDVNRIKPVWMLVMEADGEGGSAVRAALDELVRRAGTGGLGDGRLRELAAAALERQADEDRAWFAQWGDLVEAADDRGLLSEAQQAEYYSEAIEFWPQMRSRQRAGRPVRIGYLLSSGRVGSDTTFYLHEESATTSLGDHLDERKSDSSLQLRSNSSSGLGRVLDVQLPPGTYKVNVTVRLGISRERTEAPFAERTFSYDGEVELVGPDVALVEVVEDAEALGKLRRTMEVRPLRAYGPRGKGAGVNLNVSVKNCPYSLAWDVLLLDDGVETPIGTLAMVNGNGQYGIFVNLPEGFDGSTADLLFRPSVEAAEDHPEGIEQILGGEIVVEDVEVEWSE